MDRTTAPARRGGARTSLALRGLVTLALLASAYQHVAIASGPRVSDGALTLAGLFLGQAVAAALVAGWLLARPSRPAWLAAATVGLGSLAALVLTTYVQVPAVGPFPAVYEPLWYGEKVLAALTAGGAGVGALVGLTPGRAR